MNRRFHQVDVFSAEALRGNPLAVVHAAQGLDDARMAAIARWTNLSETTFLLPPTDAGADYRVRIFTPLGELPFAGHPTLGSAWAWLAAGGQPRAADRIVQECGVGLVTLRRDGQRLAFARAPHAAEADRQPVARHRQLQHRIGIGVRLHHRQVLYAGPQLALRAGDQSLHTPTDRRHRAPFLGRS